MDVLLLMWSVKMSADKWIAIMWWIWLMFMFMMTMTTEANDDDMKWLFSYQCHNYLLNVKVDRCDHDFTLPKWRRGFDCCICGEVTGVSWLRIMTTTIHRRRNDYDTTRRSTWQRGFDCCIRAPDHDDDDTAMIQPAIDDENLIVASAARRQWSSAHISTMTIRRRQYDDTTMQILRR